MRTDKREKIVWCLYDWGVWGGGGGGGENQTTVLPFSHPVYKLSEKATF